MRWRRFRFLTLITANGGVIEAVNEKVGAEEGKIVSSEPVTPKYLRTIWVKADDKM